ncbi:hypothetical protein [Histophilus somni]|uniref:hypothetical protein n=1 Tax=Histophilus somni TaxID=731 RepID=UPI00201EC7A5|nr:hypothetical protein [Histophilus somni]
MKMNKSTLLEWLTHPFSLPERSNRWLFSVGTRSLEVLNSVALIGWAWVFLTQSDAILALRPYSKFDNFPTLGASLIMFSVASGLIACFFNNTSKAQFLSGYFLLLCAGIWGVVCANFIRSYPPLNTGVIVYFALMLISWWAGLYKIDNVKKNVRQLKRKAKSE